MPDPKAPAAPFWRTKRLGEMSQREWESLCDGCGRCCLNKLIDEDTNQTVFTDVGCRLLDGETCRCTDYAHRQAKVKDCVRLTPRNVRRLSWLPPTCGYRLVAEGRDLYWWHPLVSGDPETVHEAGVSVRGRVAASEKDVPDERLEDFIVSWPGKWPKGARGSAKQRKIRGSVHSANSSVCIPILGYTFAMARPKASNDRRRLRANETLPEPGSLGELNRYRACARQGRPAGLARRRPAPRRRWCGRSRSPPSAGTSCWCARDAARWGGRKPCRACRS